LTCAWYKYCKGRKLQSSSLSQLLRSIELVAQEFYYDICVSRELLVVTLKDVVKYGDTKVRNSVLENALVYDRYLKIL